MSKILPTLLLALLLGLILYTTGAVTSQAPGSPGASAGTTQTLLETADAVSGDNFGSSLAGDGDLLAVGATDADGGDGAVYIYERDPQAPVGWSQLHRLQPFVPENSSGYGYSLALQGDTLVVGEPFSPRTNGFWQGRAYIFERNEGGPDAWGLVWQLADADDGNLRRFGEAVAIDGDLVAVSAVGADSESGVVYLYSRAAGWSRIHEITGPDGEARDWFGSALALQGDTLLVGAQMANADSANADTGAAYIFRRDQGGPDQWGLVATLLADPLQFDSFYGGAVALQDDIAVVGAYNEDRVENGQVAATQVGSAYVYGRDAGGSDAWGLLAALRPDDGATLDRFGSSLTLSGDDLWVGSPNANAGGFGQQGKVYHYGRDVGGSNAWGWLSTIAAFDNARDANLGSSLTVNGGSLLAGAPEHDVGEGAVYEIIESDAPDEAGPTYLPVTMNSWAAPTGVLVDGGTVELPDGPIVGAVPGALTEPLQVTIVETPRPSESLPGGFQPHGDAYRISARSLTAAPPDKPLLLGVPVPASADPDRLGVALYVPDGLASESDEPDTPTSSWTTAPGSYDPATNLFVITVRALLPEGFTVLLYEHPDNVPLPPPAAQTSAVAGGAVDFEVTCDPKATNTDVCQLYYYALIAGELEDAYHEFVDIHGFKAPAMIRYIGAFTGLDRDPVLTETYKAAVIAGTPCTNASGDPIAGQYSYVTHQILVCFDENDPIESIRYTVRHELFHAIQASYRNVVDDRIKRETRALAHWTVEGTASAAERSSFIMLRSPAWEIRPATEPMTSTVALREYEAQDFWVFTGLEGSQSNHYLSYLHDIFEEGATPEHVAQAIDLSDAYWQWAKNQVYEHYQPMDGSFDSGPCEIEEAAIDPAGIGVINYPGEIFADGELPPLTSALVQINVGIDRANLPVTANIPGLDDDLRYKVYLAEETPCDDSVPDDARILQNVPAGAVVYVLVSNVSATDSFIYDVTVD